MIYLEQNSIEYNNDIRAMLQAFYKDEKIVISEEGTRLSLKAHYSGVGAEFVLSDQDGYYDKKTYIGDYKDKKNSKNPIKAIIYNMLVTYSNKTLFWGTLTGIRPTKIALNMLEKGIDENLVINHYEEEYLTNHKKGAVCVEIGKKELEICKNIDFENEYSIYIGIPFCPSTCLYCSFTSYPIALYKEKVRLYLNALKKEFKYVSQAYKNKKLRTIYIGGGTPTSLLADELDELINNIYEYFDTKDVNEFTVEAGRPDSITIDKLEVLKKHNIKRISINPQTMNDATLKLIGRAHSASDTIRAFNDARRIGFDNINMDIIIGLPNENISDISKTLEKIYKMNPDSITMHSLAIKRAASLNIEMEKYKNMIKGSTNDMIDLVDSYARQLDMTPYYLYRQKNIPGNLENIGYSKIDKECLYNILIIEEKMDIIAMGAGASTKLINKTKNCVERIENVKNVDEYISRIDEMISRKQLLMS